VNAAANGAARPYTADVDFAVILALVALTIAGVAIDHWFVTRPR
jgi:hypothetical protein